MRRKDILIAECPICGNRELNYHCALEGFKGKYCNWFRCMRCKAYGHCRDKHRWAPATNTALGTTYPDPEGDT